MSEAAIKLLSPTGGVEQLFFLEEELHTLQRLVGNHRNQERPHWLMVVILRRTMFSHLHFRSFRLEMKNIKHCDMGPPGGRC